MTEERLKEIEDGFLCAQEQWEGFRDEAHELITEIRRLRTIASAAIETIHGEFCNGPQHHALCFRWRGEFSGGAL